MPRLKRSSTVLNKAERRAAALKSISPSLDLGNGLTLETFDELIQDMQDKLEAYNMALSAVDAAHSKVEELERSLRNLSEHMLLGVAVKYGKNSVEYEMAGGTRKSDRKRPVRKAKVEPDDSKAS
ncbi:MAG: hypothetical protein HC840_05100 [Leptolyngbyaceae cyanobacterium RM2_2_4]|nr:hypothetical protein [Leptolyngbyaceae cyanobacterium SM1_4_3]NJN91421.1 hypothetical protein [Leptolyngbyaceae cyanobacterium SL_5_14]NJO48949.1 hypothetical protein [Leptolyngbyaceae cyanobacterium RM2_2_4]